MTPADSFVLAGFAHAVNQTLIGAADTAAQKHREAIERAERLQAEMDAAVKRAEALL